MCSSVNQRESVKKCVEVFKSLQQCVEVSTSPLSSANIVSFSAIIVPQTSWAPPPSPRETPRAAARRRGNTPLRDTWAVQYSTVVQQYCSTAVQLYSSTAVQLYSSSAVQLYSNTAYFFRGLSLALSSHYQFKASHWSTHRGWFCGCEKPARILLSL